MADHAGHKHAPAGGDKHAAHPQGETRNRGGNDHAHMVADFRRRFWVSLALTLPVLALSSGLWNMLGRVAPLTFRGDAYVLFGFSSIVFLYGGRPFLKGFGEELMKSVLGACSANHDRVGVF